MKKTLIIAEAGVNHNGSVTTALELVSVAAEAGADIVKFQTFKANRLANASVKMADYQKNNTGIEESQFDMLKRLELTPEMHFQIEKQCQKLGIQFMSTPFDEGSLEFLTSTMKMGTVKVPSGEITNGPFLLAVARCHKKIILSTGMSTLGDIESALQVIAFGLLNSTGSPNVNSLNAAYRSTEGQRLLKDLVTLLHCTTEYPAPIDEINLNAMGTLGHAFGLKVGYSDHSLGFHIPIAAVAMGATVIEKHFTLDKNLAGPDHKASLEPAELREMIAKVREIERAMGQHQKLVVQSEEKNRQIARKVIVAKCEIRAGDTLSFENLDVLRAGKGLSPMGIWNIVGQVAGRNYSVGDAIIAAE
jgi:N-acetylneuraminate synthase